MNLIEIKRATPTLYVYWTLTDMCNFKCSYCPDELHKGIFAKGIKPGFPTSDSVSKFVDNLLEQHLNGRFLNMTISGGEPTTHPMFKEIVNRLHGKGSVEIVTNASRSVDWWKDMEHLPDKVTISLHPEFSKLEKINETALYMIEQGVDVVFNLMCDPDNWDWVMNVKDKLDQSLYAHINAKILTDHKNKETEGKPFSYYEEQLAFIKTTQSTLAGSDPRKRVNAVYDNGEEKPLKAFELVNEGKNKFKGWSCSAGSDGIRVSFDGNVYAVCNVKRLGRLDTFKLEEQDIICPKERCKAANGITINKRLITSVQDQ